MFKLIRKLIGVGCLFAGFAWGQNTGQNVISQVVINGVAYSGTSTNVVLPILQNIGQTSHLVKLYATTRSGTVLVSVQMQGSIDTVCGQTPGSAKWLNIGPLIAIFPITFTAPNTILTAIGYGAFPCLRVNTTIDTTSGTATIYENYSGFSAPAFQLADQYGVINGILNVSNTGTDAGAQIVIGSSIGEFISLYGFSFSLPAGITKLVLACTSGTPVIDTVINSVAGQVVRPLGLRPYGICSQNDSLTLTATGTGTFAYNFQYRFE